VTRAACGGEDGGVDIQGQVDARFEPVRECFAEVVRGQAGTGAAFTAWCGGRVVADLWGGWADQGRTRPWREDSVVQPYSVSKPFVAVCALRLVEAGQLDLDAPVQRYWPEFRAPATVRHVLSHQAGVVALDEPVPTEVFYDWDRLCALLADQEPSWEPGTAHGESALFYGHLVGELVRRVDGRSPGRFLREEICGPAGLDFFFGLSPGMLAEAVSPQCSGPDRVFGHENAWGLGFGIDDACYGMGGLGGNYGGFGTDGGYAIGFVTGSAGSFARADALENTLRSCLGLPPLPDAIV
jgi:CubicO group peptidase (beta-lactamase class C family)